MEKAAKFFTAAAFALVAFGLFIFGDWQDLGMLLLVFTPVALWVAPGKTLAILSFTLALYVLVRNWSSSHPSEILQLVGKFLDHEGDHAKNGLIRLDQSIAADQYIKYQVKRDTWPIKCCRRNNFDKKTGQLINDKGIGAQEPLPLKAGTIVRSSFSTSEQKQETWKDDVTWYQGEKYLPVNRQKEGSHGKMFEFGDKAIVYLVDPDDLTKVGSVEKPILIKTKTAGVTPSPKPTPAPILVAAATPPPAAPTPVPAPPAPIAQPKIPEENVEWTGSRSLYNPSVWSAGHTVVQRVTLNGNAIDVWAIYLYGQGGEDISLPANPGANLQICQARTGLTGVPPTSFKSVYTEQALTWNPRQPREDRECNYLALFENHPRSGVMDNIKIGQQQGGKNFVIVADYKVRDSGINPNLKAAAGFTGF